MSTLDQVEEPRKVVAACVVLVTGGRDYADRGAVFRALHTMNKRKGGNITILHGGCPTGADALAHSWAIDNQRPVIVVPAEWDKYGDSAGPRRNALMLAYLPHGCIAFPGGAGTDNMVQRARDAELPVWSPEA